MQAPKSFASAHRAAAGGNSHSTRAAVYGIFQDTDALLAGFRTEFLANARARHAEIHSYRNHLQQSVQSMLAELREAREDTTNGVRSALKDYMADLHANVAEAMQEANVKLRKISRQRQGAAHEFAQTRTAEVDALKEHGRQQLEELADGRRHATQSLHDELGAFAAELHSRVEQTRGQNRQELGFGEPAPVKAKPRRKEASQPKARKEEAPEKGAAGKVKARPAAMAARTTSAKAKPQANARKTVKTVAGAQTRKRRAH